jgi:hypothetical protein
MSDRSLVEIWEEHLTRSSRRIDDHLCSEMVWRLEKDGGEDLRSRQLGAPRWP